MTNSKMTERAIYTAIVNGEDLDHDVLVEFAEKKLAQLDKRNASAAKRAAAKRAEGDTLTEAVYALLDEEPKTRDEVAEMYNEANESDLSVAKIGARLNSLFAADRIQKTNVKVGNSTKVGYFIAE